MNMNDVQVVVCGRTFTPNWCEWKQTPDDFPRISLDATISPHNMTPLSVLANSFKSPKSPTIKDVIFNPPATIVFWSDNTKTVVKADYGYDNYDPEKGIAMAIAKKMMGDNKYEYYNTFLHWLKKWDKQQKKNMDSEPIDISQSKTTVKKSVESDEWLDNL